MIATSPKSRLPKGAYAFRIYIAGGQSNSVQALANLYGLCRRHFPECHRIEVIDVLTDPVRALADSIFVTPTTIRCSPLPELHVIGNLSDEAEMLLALGLPSADASHRTLS